MALILDGEDAGLAAAEKERADDEAGLRVPVATCQWCGEVIGFSDTTGFCSSRCATEAGWDRHNQTIEDEEDEVEGR